MRTRLSHYRQRLKQKGVAGVAASQWLRFRTNNPVVGRAIELAGNKVSVDGMIFSVDCPQLTTGRKSSLAFGIYEMEERALIKRWLPSEFPVLEFGGGLGVVSCLLNRKLANPFQHLVVEANPAMITLLEHNRDINCRKFKVINKAIGCDGDHVDLNIDIQFYASSIKGQSVGRTARVRTATASSLMIEMDFAEAGIVCDVEGAEVDLISREIPTLGSRIKFIMAEMHPKIVGEDVVRSLMNDLTAFGFVLKEQLGDVVFFARD